MSEIQCSSDGYGNCSFQFFIRANLGQGNWRMKPLNRSIKDKDATLNMFGLLLIAAGFLFWYKSWEVPEHKYAYTSGQRFFKDHSPYFVYSANYWQAMNMASITGNRTRFLRDLDSLASMGVNNVRIMAGTEGPDDEPFRITPSLMPSPGKYNQDILDGLDFAIYEMGKRNLTIVLCLNNYWHWSGGFSQYVSWATGQKIPYPASWDRQLNKYTNGSLDSFTQFTDRFYKDSMVRKRTMEIFKSHIKFILTHKNKYTGVKL